MVWSTDIWKILAGVAIFLLGTNFMEESLGLLAGRKFKLFLKKQTSQKIKAIGGGALVTALLQSSSVVNMLVLSLVGAGVIKMQNALAVMLGSNLGTTFSNWLIAAVGFRFDIDHIVLPVAGVTGICLVFFTSASRWYQWSKFLFGLSFLFVGLGFIKTGMAEVISHAGLAQLGQYPVLVYFLAGMLLTAVIQSSSATMALMLSALYTDAITLYIATAFVLGAEIGTTFKLFLAAAKGLAVKKRVAMGNFLFNIATALVILVFLGPVNHLISDVMRIDDKLLALVFFQSFVNITGIFLFYPLLGVLGRFLEKHFAADDESVFIGRIAVADTGLALDALEKEAGYFIFHTLDFIGGIFGLPHPDAGILHKDFVDKPVAEQYDYIKRLHGEIHGFCIRLQSSSLSKKETERLGQLSSCVRNCMYAAKSMRDALQDIAQFKNSSNDTKYNFYLLNRGKIARFLEEVNQVQQERKNGAYGDMTRIYQSMQQDYTKSLQELYREGMESRVNELEISTFINFNRQVFTAFKSILFALKDYLLTPEEADYFDELPGFIR